MRSKSASAVGLEAQRTSGRRRFLKVERDTPLGKSNADMVRLDSCNGKMFKKERRKWDFFGEMISHK
jgi:hypothetical protein